MPGISRLARIRGRMKLWRCARVGGAPHVTGPVWIHGGGSILIGDRVRIDASSAPIELFADRGARLVIGNDVSIEGGTSIEASVAVSIGDRSVLEGFTKVIDNNFHPLRGNRHERPLSVPVRVEPDARIGARAILLPGAHVRQGAVIKAGAVVRGPPAASRVKAPTSSPAGEAHHAGPRESRFDRFFSRAADIALKLTAALRAALLFRQADLDGLVYARGRVLVRNEGLLQVGARVTFVGGMVPSEVLVHPGADCSVGARSVLNYGVSIEAYRSVRIGQRCMFGSFVRVCDHGADRTSPILIGDDVWLAHGVVVEPGVTIGDGSVVSAGSIVTRDVPAHSLAAGNPARSVRLALLSEEPRGAGR